MNAPESKYATFDDWFFACNGEVRIRKSSFSGGWMALAAIEEFDIDKLWDEVDSKYDHMNAIKEAESNENMVLILDAPNSESALARCMDAFREMQTEAIRELESLQSR